MKRHFKIIRFALFVIFGFLSCNESGKQDNRPNFVFILIDDLGWKDLGFMGSEYYETPHIDHLAKNGMIFTQAYANAANCAPTRACLLSGQYTPRHGVYTVGKSDRGNPEDRRLIPTKNNLTVPLEKVFISEMLKTAGYKSAVFGKWHVGNTPAEQGFDFENQGSDFNGHFNEKGEYLADYLTNQAVEFIKENNPGKTGFPFFLYLAHMPFIRP